MSVRLLIVTLAAVGLAACSADNTAKPVDTDTASATPTPTPTPTWPLTGITSLKASDTKPVLVVKVENDPSVRPQYGLGSADIVFEELVEGGITRFAAIFQSQFPKEIGPVRSVRHVDASIASPVADLFAFSGGARPTLNYLNSNLPQSVTLVTEGTAGFHRTNYHYPPHNLYLDPLRLIASQRKSTTAVEPYFSHGTRLITSNDGITKSSALGKLTKSVDLQFSGAERPSWTWSANKQAWVRFDNRTPAMTVMPSGTQRIQAKNLVILRVKSGDAGYRDPAGNFVPRTIFTGVGQGYVFSQGKRLLVTWSKASLTSHVILKDKQGNRVSLSPGNSWVELIPLDGGSVTFQSPKVPVASATATP